MGSLIEYGGQNVVRIRASHHRKPSKFITTKKRCPTCSQSILQRTCLRPTPTTWSIQAMRLILEVCLTTTMTSRAIRMGALYTQPLDRQDLFPFPGLQTSGGTESKRR